MRRRTLLAAAPSDPAEQKVICAEIERQFSIDVPYVPLGAVARRA